MKNKTCVDVVLQSKTWQFLNQKKFLSLIILDFHFFGQVKRYGTYFDIIFVEVKVGLTPVGVRASMPRSEAPHSHMVNMSVQNPQFSRVMVEIERWKLVHFLS